MEELILKIIHEKDKGGLDLSNLSLTVERAHFSKESGILHLFITSNYIVSQETIELVKKEIERTIPGISYIDLIFKYQNAINDPMTDAIKPSIAAAMMEKEKTGVKADVKPVGKRVSKFVLEPCTKIEKLTLSERVVYIEGEIISKSVRTLKSGRMLLIIVITDHTESMCAKKFLSEKQAQTIPDSVKEGDYVKIEGVVTYDKFENTNVFMAKRIKKLDNDELPQRKDLAREKRIELHAHTKMSAMDGLPEAKDLVKRAAEWGHEAIAITDHGVVQAFPDAMSAGKKNGIKILYGMEGYLLNDDDNEEFLDIEGEYVVFDLETTGFSPVNNEIIEIGAARVKERKIVDQFHSFVKPKIANIPLEITELTDITDDMVKDADPIETVLPKFLEYVGDSTLAAHNSSFDVSFIRANCHRMGIPYTSQDVDTLYLSRVILTDLKRHKLNVVANHLGISQEHHHRADDDARTTAVILIKFFEMLEEAGIRNVNDAPKIHGGDLDYKTKNTNHIIIFAKNLVGLENLYRLVSMSHMDYFYKKPRVPKSVLTAHREGLILGGACQDGEIYQSILNGKSEAEIRRIAGYYDYFELQPISNNEFLVEEGKVASLEALRDINRTIVQLAEEMERPVVATCDVHYLEPDDSIYRQIIMKGQGYKDVESDSGLYLRTTEEMLQEFSYLGEETAKAVVIDNPKRIAEEIQVFNPVPKEKYPPEIPGSEENLRNLCYSKAKEIYGENLPKILESRLERELNSIISNGYAVLYIISHKLVAKSMSDDYVVGSRGSVGSSLAATMSGITEVNPLPPHYVCPNCKHYEFPYEEGWDEKDEKAGCGVDLPDKVCPECQTPYRKDGFDIPFEVFLGFEGDKEPDIDLNFAGEYQPVAHKYIEELFGKDHVFRAGTIGTVAAKTAYGFVLKYFEEKGRMASKWEVARLAKGCEGVKRTTGQHPGGIIIVPTANDIHQFCPIQHPANDASSGIITTHFDYHSIDQNLLKLDILGHDGPSMIKMLKDLTGIDPNDAPLKDLKVDSLFNGTEALELVDNRFRSNKGSLGIPEFGTKFVRQMLEDTKPKSFADLVRIAGLSHGTDVWLNNAQEFILNGTAELKDVISVRDDILNFLRDKGVEASLAFKIMESVRKGKGVSGDFEEKMLACDVPEWYIESCRRIQYMFPKAHAVAYVMMSYRIAYFKVYYPQAFYSVFFTMKLMDFNSDVIMQGVDAILERMNEIDAKGKGAVQKELSEYTILELALELYCRGLEFAPVSLHHSDADKFKVMDDKVLLPFAALSGVGENAARALYDAIKEGPFLSIDELQQRSKLNRTAIASLENSGVLAGIPKSNQLCFI